MDCSRIRRAPTSATEVQSHVVGCVEAPSIKDGIGMSIRGKEVDVGIASDEEAWRRREAMALVTDLTRDRTEKIKAIGRRNLLKWADFITKFLVVSIYPPGPQRGHHKLD